MVGIKGSIKVIQGKNQICKVVRKGLVGVPRVRWNEKALKRVIPEGAADGGSGGK